MEIGIRDGIYIGIYFIMIATIWNNFKNDIKNNQKDVKKLSELFKKIMFTESGQINFVSHVQCDNTKKTMREELKEGRTTTQKAFDEIDKMSKNILLILYHLKINKDDIELPK
jgi:hypothetical protein